MKTTIAYILPSVIFITCILFFPHVEPLNAQGLVPCGNSVSSIVNECQICQIQVLALNVLNIIITGAVLVAALLFLNAGVLYITSSTNPGNISKAHKIFTNTLIGLIIILAAWLIVNMIMSTLYAGSPLSTSAAQFGDWRTILDCGVGFVP